MQFVNWRRSPQEREQNLLGDTSIRFSSTHPHFHCVRPSKQHTGVLQSLGRHVQLSTTDTVAKNVQCCCRAVACWDCYRNPQKGMNIMVQWSYLSSSVQKSFWKNRLNSFHHCLKSIFWIILIPSTGNPCRLVSNSKIHPSQTNLILTEVLKIKQSEAH